MITITILWKERGYNDNFWATESCPSDQALTVARRLIAAARAANPGVYHMRARVGGAR